MAPTDFKRYLRAKRTVDDRSLDRRLVDDLRTGLRDLSAERDGPIRVLEAGAGIGTMIERLLEWDVLPRGSIEYTAVDIDPANTAALPERLRAWADEDRATGEGGTAGEWTAERSNCEPRRPDGVELSGPSRRVSVTVETRDAAAFVADGAPGSLGNDDGGGDDRGERNGGERNDGDGREWDLVIGMAFLDIVDDDTVSTLVSALAPGGYWYFPVTFDGGTRFAPDHPADDAVERQYHRHMDAKPGGDSRAGQHALDRLRGLDGVTVTGVAGSDWAVYPRGGSYPADEAYFLRYILGTIETALGELDRGGAIDDATLDDWLDTRRDQLADGELVYLTHQLDLLGRVGRVEGQSDR